VLAFLGARCFSFRSAVPRRPLRWPPPPPPPVAGWITPEYVFVNSTRHPPASHAGQQSHERSIVDNSTVKCFLLYPAVTSHGIAASGSMVLNGKQENKKKQMILVIIKTVSVNYPQIILVRIAVIWTWTRSQNFSNSELECWLLDLYVKSPNKGSTSNKSNSGYSWGCSIPFSHGTLYLKLTKTAVCHSSESPLIIITWPGKHVVCEDKGVTR
jgi:hypothetical protein